MSGLACGDGEGEPAGLNGTTTKDAVGAAAWDTLAGDGGVWLVPPTDPAAGTDETPVPVPDGAGAGVDAGVDVGVLNCTTAIVETGATELVAGVEKGI